MSPSSARVKVAAALMHSGPFAIVGDTVIEPTGTRVTLHGVTAAELVGDKIASFREYWDAVEFLEQLATLALQ